MNRIAVAVVALSAPAALGQGLYLSGTGTFGVAEDAFGIATPLELMVGGDTFSFDIPLLGFESDPGHDGGHGGAREGGHDGGHLGGSQLYYSPYPTDAAITFDVGAIGHAHTYGLGEHGLTYEVRDNAHTHAGMRDQLVIEWWPTPNTVSRHGGSIFTYSMTLSFAPDEWSGVAPLDAIDLSRVVGFGGYLADDEDRRIAIDGLSAFSVPTPGGAALLAAGGLALARRRR
ncbi:MAG: hypothetical protein AAGH64_03585 [Planctomycetota bacterium]